MVKTLLPNPYRAGIYTPDGWDTAWKAGRALAGSQQVCIIVVGDSITQGAKHPTNWYTGGYATLVKNGLVGRYGPLAGEYAGACDNAQLATGIDSGSIQATWNPSTSQSVWAMVGYSIKRTMATNDTLTFTPVQAFTDFDAIVHHLSTGTNTDFTLKVDGVAQTASIEELVDNTGTLQTVSSPAVLTCNSLNSGADTTNPHRWVRYRGWSGVPFSNATHSVVLTASSGNALTVGGLQVYPSGRAANGLVWVRHALYGQTARSLSFGPYAQQFPNYRPGYASVFDWKPSPSLVICALGINDSDAQQYGSDMIQQALDEVVRPAQQIGASVLMLQNYWNTSSWRQNAATIKNLCDSYCAAFVDMSYLFGSDAAASSLITTPGSDYHPNAAGHTLIANTLLSVL